MSYGAQMMLRKVDAALHPPRGIPPHTSRSVADVLDDIKGLADDAIVAGNSTFARVMLDTVDHLARLKAVEEAMVPRSERC